MRTRSDAQQETLARRLALLRADSSEKVDEPASPFAEDEVDLWWGGHTCVPEAPDPEVPTGPALPVAVPVTVPMPGRHASRRPVAIAPRMLVLPEALRGRVRLGPAQLAVVALVLVAALAVTCWWLARGRATALSTPVAASSSAPLASLGSPAVAPVVDTGPAATEEPTTAASTGASAGVSSGASSGETVTVDVEGRVRRPGIVILPTGSRVTDALKAAGGVPHRRSLHGLNLAAVLVDGQQIMVGATVSTSGSVPIGTSAGSVSDPAADGAPPVNLNTATADQLDSLPDVGPVTAQSILEWRQQNGGFTSVQQLLDVDGIGPATLAKLAPHVTI